MTLDKGPASLDLSSYLKLCIITVPEFHPQPALAPNSFICSPWESSLLPPPHPALNPFIELCGTQGKTSTQHPKSPNCFQCPSHLLATHGNQLSLHHSAPCNTWSCSYFLFPNLSFFEGHANKLRYLWPIITRCPPTASMFKHLAYICFFVMSL